MVNELAVPGLQAIGPGCRRSRRVWWSWEGRSPAPLNPDWSLCASVVPSPGGSTTTSSFPVPQPIRRSPRRVSNYRGPHGPAAGPERRAGTRGGNYLDRSEPEAFKVAAPFHALARVLPLPGPPPVALPVQPLGTTKAGEGLRCICRPRADARGVAAGTSGTSAGSGLPAGGKPAWNRLTFQEVQYVSAAWQLPELSCVSWPHGLRTTREERF